MEMGGARTDGSEERGGREPEEGDDGAHDEGELPPVLWWWSLGIEWFVVWCGGSERCEHGAWIDRCGWVHMRCACLSYLPLGEADAEAADEGGEELDAQPQLFIWKTMKGKWMRVVVNRRRLMLPSRLYQQHPHHSQGRHPPSHLPSPRCPAAPRACPP